MDNRAPTKSALNILTDRYRLVFTPNEKLLFKQSVVALLVLVLLHQIEILKLPVRVLLSIILFNLGHLLFRFTKPVPKKVETPKPKKTVQTTPYKNVSTPISLQKSPLKSQRLLMSRSNIPLNSTPEGPDMGSPQPFMQRISLPTTFQNGLKPAMSPVKEIIEDGMLFIDAEKTLAKWNVGQFIDAWSENIRMWIATKVLQPLVKRMDTIDSELKANGMELLSMDKLVTRAQIQSLIIPQAAQELVLKRLKIERYFDFEPKARDYILDRYRQLSKGSCLSQFKWNSGTQKFNNNAWNQDKYPSDAYLVMMLFCRFMDENYPGSGFEDVEHPFSIKYFAGERKSHGIQIRQGKKFPAHFQILIDCTCYNVASGRNNVFDCLALFVYQIKVVYNGYVGMLYLGGKSIDLLSVLQVN